MRYEYANSFSSELYRTEHITLPTDTTYIFRNYCTCIVLPGRKIVASAVPIREGMILFSISDKK
jgi:hypothetical protein